MQNGRHTSIQKKKKIQKQVDTQAFSMRDASFRVYGLGLGLGV